MERRSDLLIQELKDLLGTDEVYFQPSWGTGSDDGSGESYILTNMRYPCFVLERTTAWQPSANDRNYVFRPGYQVTYLNPEEPDPIDMIQAVMARFGHCKYQRHFVKDNLHHDVFLIYY